jgi:hypothetical protein
MLNTIYRNYKAKQVQSSQTPISSQALQASQASQTPQQSQNPRTVKNVEKPIPLF